MAQDKPLATPDLPDLEHEVRRLLDAGHSAEANTLFDDALAQRPPVTDQAARACVLLARAVLAWRLGRIPLALELAAEGWTDLDAARPRGAAAAETISLFGYLLEGIGHPRAAMETLRTAVHLADDADEPEILAACLQRLGGALNFRAIDGPPEHACATFAEAKSVLARGLRLPAHPRMYRALLGAYSRSLAGLGELAEAEDAANRVLALSIQTDHAWAQGVAHWVLAAVQRQRRRLVEARTLAARAVAAVEPINDNSLLMRFSQDLADICAELEDAVGEAAALRLSLSAARKAAVTLREGLGQALEQRRLAVQAKRIATAAQEAAARDPLTGLVNRLGLQRHAPQLLTAAVDRGQRPCLVLIDIDWFKSVNDHAGHAAGDAALREIAQLVRRECRAEDVVARWAGDEFVVLLGDADAGSAVAERIRATVASHDWAIVLGSASRPTVSIGLAAGPRGLDELFAAADMALYQAKRSGRNRVVVYHQVDGRDGIQLADR